MDYSILNSGGHFVRWIGSISSIFGRENYVEHSNEIIYNLDLRFRKRCHLKKKFMDGRFTTDSGQRLITIAYLESLNLVS